MVVVIKDKYGGTHGIQFDENTPKELVDREYSNMVVAVDKINKRHEILFRKFDG
jgi:hypothetical protein